MRDAERADALLEFVQYEMSSQDRKWGWPKPESLRRESKTLTSMAKAAEAVARCEMELDRTSWLGILLEEVGEVARAEDENKQVDELIQVAAVAVSWAQALVEAYVRASPVEDLPDEPAKPEQDFIGSGMLWSDWKPKRTLRDYLVHRLKRMVRRLVVRVFRTLLEEEPWDDDPFCSRYHPDELDDDFMPRRL